MELLHLGRGTDNEVIIQDASVSRKHAQLFIEADGGALIIDLNSTNGTFVNGQRIDGQYRLRPGDAVHLGDHPFDWERMAPRAQPNASLPPPPPPEPTPQTPRPSQRVWIGVSFAALVGIVVLLVIVLRGAGVSGGNGETDELLGKWQSEDDPQAAIELATGGKYSETYAGEPIYEDASWEIKGDDRLLIRKQAVTVLYQYALDGDRLQLIRTQKTESYKRQE
ncbi:MAG: FHA domain-containing protein [Bacteroidota bacterium]